MSAQLEFRCVHGTDIAPWLDVVADLRIRVFREFPYVYEGSREYEARYLQTYVDCPRSIAVLALDGSAVVGVSTGLPLQDEVDAFTRPFVRAGLPVEDFFYCAETVLLPEYRGRGQYRNFFAAREAHARELELMFSCFCGVRRPDDHPLRPADYRPLDPVWLRYGYEPRPDLVAFLPWKDLGEETESEKPLQFFLKDLRSR